MLDIKYYISVFSRRLPYFLIVATIISAASIIVAMNIPPAYVSSVKLIIESPQIPGNLAEPTATTPAREQLQIVEQRLMTRANLLDIAARWSVLKNQAELTPDQIVQAMAARTSINSSSGRNEASLMTVSFEAPSAKIAAGVVNEYLTLILREDVKSRTGRATQTLEFFQQEVDRLSGVLASRSAGILEFKTENADALPESLEYRLGQQSLLQERLAQLQREISTLSDQRTSLIKIFESTGQVTSVNETAGTPEEIQLNELRRQLNEALVIYSPENPQIKLLQARIDQVEAVVRAQPSPVDTGDNATGNSLLDVQLAGIETRQAILQEREIATTKELAALVDTISRTPANAIKLDKLELAYANTQQQYNRAVDRLSRASTGERIEMLSRGQRISVIEPPAIPNAPTKPNRKLIAGGGSFLGILAGLGLVFLLETLNQSIRRPEDLVKKLGITPIATIPHIRSRGEHLTQLGFKLLRILLIIVGLPALVYAIHTYYLPLDLLADQIMNKLGVRW